MDVVLTVNAELAIFYFVACSVALQLHIHNRFWLLFCGELFYSLLFGAVTNEDLAILLGEDAVGGSEDRSLIHFGLEDINTPGRAQIHLVSDRNTSLRILAVPAIS